MSLELSPRLAPAQSVWLSVAVFLLVRCGRAFVVRARDFVQSKLLALSESERCYCFDISSQQLSSSSSSTRRRSRFLCYTRGQRACQGWHLFFFSSLLGFRLFGFHGRMAARGRISLGVGGSCFFFYRTTEGENPNKCSMRSPGEKKIRYPSANAPHRALANKSTR